MATTKSAKYPYRWSNGTYHSRPENTPVATTGRPSNLGAWGHTVAPGSPVLNFQAGGSQATSAGPPIQPLDPDAENARITGIRNVGISDAYAGWQLGNLDQQYGFGATGAANPYSEAALLKVNYDRSKLGTTNSMAAQGQLYSGAYGRAQDENTRQYDIGYDRLRRAYDQQTKQVGFNQAQTYADAGTGVSDANWQALLKALKGL